MGLEAFSPKSVTPVTPEIFPGLHENPLPIEAVSPVSPVTPEKGNDAQKIGDPDPATVTAKDLERQAASGEMTPAEALIRLYANLHNYDAAKLGKALAYAKRETDKALAWLASWVEQWERREAQGLPEPWRVEAPATARPAQAAKPVAIEVWTPAGTPLTIQARDEAHADWIRRMNPKPSGGVSSDSRRPAPAAPIGDEVPANVAEIAQAVAQECGTAPAFCLSLLDGTDLAAIASGDPAMLEAWRTAVRLHPGKPAPRPEPSEPSRIERGASTASTRF